MRCRQLRMQRIMTVFLVFCLTSLASFGQGAQSGQTPPAENTDTSAPASESDPSGNPPANAGDPNTASTPNLAGTPNPAASTAGYVFPSNRQIVRFGYRGVAGIRALAGSAFTASWNTWVDTTPREWHRDASGWGKRFGTSILDHGINQHLFENTTYMVESGGDPLEIPDLTHAALKDFHARHYHPSQAVFMTAGNVDVAAVQAMIADRVLSRLPGRAARMLPQLAADDRDKAGTEPFQATVILVA